jgi:hypothetical protein
MAYDKYDTAVEITESASEIAGAPYDAVYVGTSGDLVVNMRGTGSSITFKSVPAGTVLEIGITHLLTASTCADVIVLESGRRYS